MTYRISSIAVGLACIVIVMAGRPGNALPLAAAPRVSPINAEFAPLTLAQFRPRRGRVIVSRNRGPDIGAIIAAGIFGGVIFGLMAQPRYLQPPRYYDNYYYPGAPYSFDRNAAVAYCMQRYRSYDPYSMTYLGYDGYRHPCP